MLNAQTDLEEIHRFFSLPRERVIELLTRYIEAWNGHEIPDIAEIPESVSLTASVLLWASVRRVNHDLSSIHVSAKWQLDGSEEHIADRAATIQQMVPLIKKLRGLLPKDVTMVGEIVQHGGSEARSWMNIAISNAGAFVSIPNLNATVVNKLFESIEYDPEHVELRLEAEQDRFYELPFHSPGIPGDKSTIGDAILRLMRGEANTSGLEATTGTKSVPEQTEKQTIEQTVSDQKQTEVGLNSSTEKKPWTKLATDLKKRWFAEMRKRKSWIPRKAFFIDFFAGSDGQRGKWKELSPITEDRRFQDNPDRWKTESEALKDSLKNRR